MEKELIKYNNLKTNIENLARDIDLAISSLNETDKLLSNFKIDDVSKGKNTIQNIITNLSSSNKFIRNTVYNNVKDEISKIKGQINS